jgi:hypothetical protein
MLRSQKIGRKHNIKVANKPFDDVENSNTSEQH